MHDYISRGKFRTVYTVIRTYRPPNCYREVQDIESKDSRGTTVLTGIPIGYLTDLRELEDLAYGAKPKFLVALPTFRGSKGFCHQTVLVSAKDEDDARSIVRHIRPHRNIGDIRKVNY